MIHELIHLALWGIAIVSTLLLTDGGGGGHVAPVLFICMVGSLLNLRMARGRSLRKT